MRVFLHGRLMNSFGVFDRNRREIALRLDQEKYQFLSFSNLHAPLPKETLLAMNKGCFQKRKVADFTPTDAVAETFKYTSPVRKLLDPALLLFYGARIKSDIYQSQVAAEVRTFKRFLRIRNPNIKHVLTLYGLPSDNYKEIGRQLSQEANLVTCVSKTTAREAKEEYGIDCEVIYDGIDTDFYAPSERPERKPTVLYVGTLQKRKNPDMVVRLAKEFPRYDFMLHGRGEEMKTIRRLAGGMKNLRFSISYLTPTELKNLYLSADIFLFPSVHEGFANVVLEAAACGLPILGLNATSMPEFITDGVEGYLAEDFENLRERLKTLLEDRRKRLAMGAKARMRAEEFSWDKIAPRYGVLFDAVHSDG